MVLNPFKDGSFVPLEDDIQTSTVPSVVSGAWSSAEPNLSKQDVASVDNDRVNETTGADYLLRKEALDLREKDLDAREEDLRNQKNALIASGALKPEKNWPICYPVVHHDIKGEVPLENQRLVIYCYWSYVGLLLCLTMNWFCALMAMCVINASNGRLAGFLLATIYWFAGIPGGWILWYMRIYNLAIKDRAFGYALFFIAFSVHIAFSVFAAVSPPMPFVSNWSLAGFICCIKGFDKKTFVGVVYVIGGCLWTLESLWSSFSMIQVYRNFRNGGSQRKVTSESRRAIYGTDIA